ncbi:anti-sigma factor [Actinomadura decatromicini]|uniref:Regulator of SigK n=1 Tax=Actinomadura decatromicini TaxID=2604572 RepID=A0A5D3FCN5_9ACTN|nr:anti-sigma factor [Actinomadura decatromicini]TYK46071.1 anti-sigma factor [Actinomadura decatromicini]
MTEDLHALTGAYAVDAIDDPGERARFEAHLAGCEPCAAELREFQATAARLGMAVAEPPPPELRARVLATIRNVPQTPPAPADHPGPGRASPAQAGGAVPGRVAPFPAGGAAGRVPGRRADPRPRPRPRRWRRAVAAGLAAAACLVTAASVTQVVRERQRVERAEAAYRDVASVLSAPDARAATGRAAGGGTVTVVASAARGRAVVASSGLRPLPPSRTYQLWLIGVDGPRSAGLLPADRSRPVVAGNWRPTDRVGLTVEPAGGSAQPTSTPLVLLLPA